MKILTVENLSKSFGGIHANRDISFDVEEGSILGVIGPNGAGKSTLFDLITGFTKPDTGKVKFFDKNIFGISPDKISNLGVGRTFQKLKPLIDLINPITLIRIKINNYPQTPTVIHHQDHVDGNYKHKGALFYVNTNNGATVIENKEVASVENKLVLFDSSKPHHSTTTSDSNRRITININYF